MNLTCIIIEDEPLAVERVKGFVEKVPYLNLIGTFESALEALSFLKSSTVDLIFLDINMDELSGIQLLESVQIDSEVIITTAYDEYALKGYEMSVTDYLLKPYSFERFIKAVDKAQENCLNKNKSKSTEFFFVKTENRLEKIMINDVLFIEGMGDYRRIHTSGKKVMTLQTFGELSQMVSENAIVRVHKSYMVAIDKIESIERNRIRIGEKLIPISDSYKEKFFDLIQS